MATSAKVGQGACPLKGCSGTAFFARSAGGKLKFECDCRDVTGFCDQGSDAEKSILATVRGLPKPTTKPADPDPVPAIPNKTKKATAAPDPRSDESVDDQDDGSFDLGRL